MRPIDADALLQKLCNDNPASMEDYYYNAIKDAPTVDIKTEVAREISGDMKKELDEAEHWLHEEGDDFGVVYVQIAKAIISRIEEVYKKEEEGE